MLGLPPEHRPWLLLAGAFVGGLLLRGLSAGFQDTLSHDAAVFYLPGARALATHGIGFWEGLSAANPPLFATLIALLGSAVSDLEVAALAISAIGGALIVFPVWGLARFLFPGRPAVHRYAVLLAMVQSLLVRYGGDAVADSLYSLVFIMALWSGLEVIDRPRARWAVLFGGCLGVGYLLRPEVLGLAFLAAVGAAGISFARRSGAITPPAYRVRVIGSGGLAVLALLPALAWNMTFVHEKLDVWTLSPKAGVLVNFEKGSGAKILTSLNDEKTMTHHEQALTDPSYYQEFSFDELGEVAWQERLTAWARNLKEFGIYFVEGMGPVCFLLFLLGLAYARRATKFGQAAAFGKTGTGGVWALVLVLCFYAVVLSVFYMSRRFLLPLLPLAIVWSGVGLQVLTQELRERWLSRLKSGRLLVVVVLGLVLLKSVHHVGGLEARWRYRPELELGRRLESRFGPDQVLVSAKGKVAWYAQGHHLFLPNAPLDDISIYMENRNARFLVYERRTRHKNQALEESLVVDSRFTEVDSEVGRDRTYRVFEKAPRSR